MDSFYIDKNGKKWPYETHRMEDHAFEQPSREEVAALDADLGQWWHDKAEQEVAGVLPKAVEYGSVDLEIVGFALRQMLKNDSPASNVELGVAFYLQGKVARLMGAYADGHSPSDDTWHDIAIYTKMGQRARETGGRWPK